MECLRIYSGECEHGLCGLESTMLDSLDHKLYVGDILAIASQDNLGIMSFYGLTVVIEDRPELVGKKISGDPFIKGLYGSNLSDWYIHRIKKWSDCIDGEHWVDYGFNYRKEIK